MASFGYYNRVNTNVTAMDAQLSLNKINRDLGDSRLRLSTGYKINNAEDDAAGDAKKDYGDDADVDAEHNQHGNEDTAGDRDCDMGQRPWRL